MNNRGIAFSVGLLLRVIVAAVFVCAGLVKAINPIRFTTDIYNYHLLPWSLATVGGFYLPALEVICGLALLYRRFSEGAMAVLLGLVVVFILASITAKFRGIDVSCGCFGGASQNFTFTTHLLLDITLGVMILALGAIDRRLRAMDVKDR